ncbi:hypothetical protein EPN29_08460 [bacterium]|nr:MAG: hypothetical protein EPN29_08460 [bacterium]
MNLITDDWRLKLLAFGLAVLMLGAVAFSQNPSTVITLDKVPIAYSGGHDLIVISPQTTTKVTVTGLADLLASVTSSSLVASVDLTKVNPGPSVPVNMTVRSLVAGVQVQNPVVPLALNIDRLTSIKLPVDVGIQRVTPGWQVTKKEARCPDEPCSVTFTGPSTWEANLSAHADFTDPVENSSYDVLTQPVLLVQNGSPLDLSRHTVPGWTLEPSNVAIHIEAKTGTTSRQVVLIDSPPSHGPPAGYRVTNVVVNPVTAVISGAPDVLVKITTITLPPVDLSSATSDATFKINIPYPDGITGLVAVASVTYSISRNPNTQPSPSP